MLDVLQTAYPASPVTLRPATPDDAPDIVKIRRTTWLATYPNLPAGITPEQIAAVINQRPLAVEINRLTEKLTTKLNSKTWLAQIDHQPVGFITAVKEAEHNRIEALYILPEHQKKGLGHQLLQTALDWLENKKPIYLAVVAYNSSAIGFYQQFGFNEQGIETSFRVNLPNGQVLPKIKIVKNCS